MSDPIDTSPKPFAATEPSGTLEKRPRGRPRKYADDSPRPRPIAKDRQTKQYLADLPPLTAYEPVGLEAPVVATESPEKCLENSDTPSELPTPSPTPVIVPEAVQRPLAAKDLMTLKIPPLAINAPQTPTVMAAWSAELAETDRRDGVFKYIVTKKKNSNLPLEVLWGVACGKCYVYDPDTCEREIDPETGGDLYQSPKAQDRIKAAQSLLPYLYGDPEKTITIKSENKKQFDLSKCSQAALAELEKALLLVGASAGVPDGE